MDKNVKLEELKVKFEKWRANRNGRKSIPEALLNDVTNLPLDCSLHTIHKILGLEWNKLKKLRSREKSLNDPDIKESFIEISPHLVDSRMEVIFERSGGSKMRVHLNDSSEVKGLLKLFLEQSR